MPRKPSSANLIGQRTKTRRLFVQVLSPVKGSAGVQGFAEALGDIVTNMDRGVRDGVKSRLATVIKNRAVKNINAGKRRSKYPHPLDYTHKTLPPANRLENSIVQLPTGTDTLVMSFGEGARYGRIHNLPKGTSETLKPMNSPYLIFPNRKNVAIRKTYKNRKGEVKSRMVRPKFLRAKKVQKPGTGFFSEAVEYGKKQVGKIIAEEAAYAASRVKDSDIKISERGGRIYTGGSRARKRMNP